jgi:hypothetical protein
MDADESAVCHTAPPRVARIIRQIESLTGHAQMVTSSWV